MNSRGYNGNSVPTMTGIGYQRSTPTSMLQPQSPNRCVTIAILCSTTHCVSVGLVTAMS